VDVFTLVLALLLVFTLVFELVAVDVDVFTFVLAFVFVAVDVDVDVFTFVLEFTLVLFVVVLFVVSNEFCSQNSVPAVQSGFSGSFSAELNAKDPNNPIRIKTPIKVIFCFISSLHL
jgi:hypothetical protein